jgi:hypothetical protein
MRMKRMRIVVGGVIEYRREGVYCGEVRGKGRKGVWR